MRVYGHDAVPAGALAAPWKGQMVCAALLLSDVFAAAATSLARPAYVDPTGGLPPSAWGAALAACAAGLGVALTAARLFGRSILSVLRRHRVAVGSVAVVVVLASVAIPTGVMSRLFSAFTGRGTAPAAAPGSDAAADARRKRVLVLAFDGLDPTLLDQYMADGELPNFARLAKEGVYHPLRTTNPPQSPVAWSSFITGTEPHAHGVYDFLKRDARTYRPDLTIADRRTMRLPWRGEPFWQTQPAIRDGGLTALRLPVSFPPPKLNGHLLCGMGVWDARGTEGTYFYFSTAPPAAAADQAAKAATEKGDRRGMGFELRREGDGPFRGEIPGPYRTGQPDTLREPFELLVQSGGAAELRVQGQTLTLKDGRWSDWLRLRFALGTFTSQNVDVVTRVLYRAAGGGDGRTSLYVSPLNFDPTSPLYPISHPKGYASELAGHVGCYHTRGMPYDTQALNDGVISDAAFLAQWRTIMDEDERMLAFELSRFSAGMLFSYFEGTDILQHMFWRGIDPEHPLHAADDTAANRGAILECYRRCDATLGRARAAMAGEGTIVVLSDHGFAPFRRAVHVNAILRDAGYLAVKNGAKRSGELFESVDWSRTRAYAVGFNAVYLNRAGREGQGIVAAADAPALASAVAALLEGVTDPGTGGRPIKKAYLTPASTADASVSPDLIVGYARGYRASWETALGAVPELTAEPNARKWSGDHCIDPDEVPGVFLCSDPTLDAQALVDVTGAIGRHMAH